ncbi:MAG: UDP-N-acetylmuramate dehydrogenase [Thermodesulfobacteriota bacterium]
MSLSPAQIRQIQELVSGRARVAVPLSRYASFRIGGPADLVAEPADAQELGAVLRYVDENKLPYFLLGAGTNVLFHDSGFRGVVIRTCSLGGFQLYENGSDYARVAVGAGTPLPYVVNQTARLGLEGMAQLWGIPGTFGGAVITNAGAGGSCIGDLLVQVKLLNLAGIEINLGADDLDYQYRRVSLPEVAAVLEGTVRLRRGNPDVIHQQIEEARTRRRATQPINRPSAGCVFKNPLPDKPAGMLIDCLGFKGASVGDAQVSELHANFIINRGRATAAQVLELIERIRSRVKTEEGIELELEVSVVGVEPSHD